MLYAYCGISDFVDGTIAKRMKQESEFGAKLDSVSDTAFFFSVILTILPAVVVPKWLWISTAGISLIRVTTYIIGYIKYRRFASLHTYANKITGFFLFFTPVLCRVLGIEKTGIIVCIFAFLSACEELVITVIEKELNPDRGSLFKR